MKVLYAIYSALLTSMTSLLSGGHTEEEAFEVYAESKEIFREGGFNLRKFLTNSKHLHERIDLQSLTTEMNKLHTWSLKG